MDVNSDPTERLCIPVQESEEVVIVPVSKLPDDPQEVLNVLISEAASLPLWLDFARSYLQQGDIESYQKILQEASSEEVLAEVEQYFGKKPNYEHIQCLCGFLSLHLAKLRDELETQKRKELLHQAKQLALKAKQVDPNEQLSHLAEGMVALAENKMDEAKMAFQRAADKKSNGKANIAGQLALAMMHYHTKQYLPALKLYQQALRTLPTAPAEVRLGIAACYLKLGDMDLARAAYERVIKLDPNSAMAYLGLAAISFNSQNEQQGLADGVKLLVAAYELEPSNTAVLALLAQVCLMRGEFDKARDLALAGCEAAGDVRAVRVQCFTLAGRACHALGLVQEASKYYHQATKIRESGALAHLGQAQVWLAAGEPLNASTELEAALKLAPGCQDALKLLAGLRAELPTKKADALVDHFRTGAAKAPDEPGSWAMLGELLAASNPADSLKAYEKAVALHRKKQAAVEKQRQAAAERQQQRQAEGGGLFADDEDDEEAEVEAYHVPADLLNNTAVLLYRANRVPEALEYLREATSTMQRDGTSALHKVTMGYNMARLQEETGDTKAASQAYKDILEQFPAYTDCWLRLACIAKYTGDMAQALDYCQKAVEVPGGSADAQALMGALHLQRKDYSRARQAFSGLLQLEGHKHDTYGQLGTACYYAAIAPRNPKKPEDVAAAGERWSKALEMYKRVLKEQPSNMYAAHGLGCVLAELGHLEEAKEVFSRVQEAASGSGGFLQLPEVLVNLGHIHLSRQEYPDAIKLYSNASRWHHHRDAKILLYLARAHYDADDLVAARQALLRAIHLAPSDHRLRFNLGVTLQEHAVRTFNKKRTPHDESKFDDFVRAGDELGCALQHFNYLKSKGHRHTALDMKKVNAHVSFCDSALNRAHKHIAKAEQEHLEIMARKAAQETARTKAALEKEEAAVAKRAAAIIEKEERDRRAREAMERGEQLLQQWKMERKVEDELIDDSEQGKSKGKKGKKGKKGAAAAVVDDGDLFGDEDEEEGAAAAGDEEPEYVEGGEEEEEQALLQQAGLASDDEGEQQPSARKRKRLRHATEEGAGEGAEEDAGLADEDGGDLFGDLQDEQDAALAGEVEEEEEGGGHKRARKAAVLDSDDEEAGEGGGAGGGAEGEDGEGGGEDIDDLF